MALTKSHPPNLQRPLPRQTHRNTFQELQPSIEQSTDDSNTQEWVIFGPEVQGCRLVPQAPKSPSRSSDLGSLLHLQRSSDGSGRPNNELTGPEDELDNLLPSFCEASTQTNAGFLDRGAESVLPHHDGFGTFYPRQATDDTHSSCARLSPRRVVESQHSECSRSELFSDASSDLGHESSPPDHARRNRIQKWRRDQSKLLSSDMWHISDERPMEDGSHGDGCPNGHVRYDGSASSLGTTGRIKRSKYEHDLLNATSRSILRDFMGLGESIMAMILGDRPVKGGEGACDSSQSCHGWEYCFLRKTAWRFRVPTHELAPDEWLGTEANDEYAGIPLNRLNNHRSRSLDGKSSTIRSGPAWRPNFVPTLPGTMLKPLPSVHPGSAGPKADRSSQGYPLYAFEAIDYWERKLDLKTLFVFIASRFGRNQSPPTRVSRSPANKTPVHHRAAVIKQHHPLTLRTETSRRSWGNKKPVWNSRSLRESSQWRMRTSCASSDINHRAQVRGTSTISRYYWDTGSYGSQDLGVGLWCEV